MIDLRVTVLAAGVAVALCLSGCSGAPAAASTDAAAGTPAATSAAAGDATHSPGVEPSPSPSLVTEMLPLGFPAKYVPLFDGPLLHVGHPGNIWSAWIYSTNLPGDLATATSQLVAAGYTNTNSGDGWADFHGKDYEVRVVAVVDEKFGSSLAYTIVEKVTG